ncbi:uncharacterized protein LOC143243123 [Tachypleus tridentatus]|uniref:uncharacterized protein LOC143243123 n=1 Tax=Tachypleus tridentatus TaxID=6853 RepID=UPI003FD1E8E3
MGRCLFVGFCIRNGFPSHFTVFFFVDSFGPTFENQIFMGMVCTPELPAGMRSDRQTLLSAQQFALANVSGLTSIKVCRMKNFMQEKTGHIVLAPSKLRSEYTTGILLLTA